MAHHGAVPAYRDRIQRADCAGRRVLSSTARAFCLQSGASVRITNRRNAFFPDEVLRDARAIVLEEEAMHNPEFIAELRARGFEFLFDVNHLNAISLLEVIVFHREFNKRLLFHGLVHFVQQRILGLPTWLELYVRAVLKTGLHVTILRTRPFDLSG